MHEMIHKLEYQPETVKINMGAIFDGCTLVSIPVRGNKMFSQLIPVEMCMSSL